MSLSDAAVLKSAILSAFPGIKEENIVSVVPGKNVCMKNGVPYGYEMTMTPETRFPDVYRTMDHCQMVSVYRFPNEKVSSEDEVVTLKKEYFQKRKDAIHALEAIVSKWSSGSSVVYTEDNLLLIRGSPLTKTATFGTLDGTLGSQILDHNSEYWKRRQLLDATVKILHDEISEKYGEVFKIKPVSVPCRFMFNTIHGAAPVASAQNGLCKLFVGGSCSRHDLTASPINNKIEHYVYANALDGYYRAEYPSSICNKTEFIPADVGVKTGETYRDVKSKLSPINGFHHEMIIVPESDVTHRTMFGHVTDSDDSNVSLVHLLNLYEKEGKDAVIPVRTSSEILPLILNQYSKKFANRSFASLWKPLEDNKYVGIEKSVLQALI